MFGGKYNERIYLELCELNSNIGNLEASISTMTEEIKELKESITGPLEYNLGDVIDQVSGENGHNLKDVTEAIEKLHAALIDHAGNHAIDILKRIDDRLEEQ